MTLIHSLTNGWVESDELKVRTDNMDITFLGTGAGVPAKHRNVTSIAISHSEYSGDTWLFDCGEATQHQILYTNVKLSKIKVIFITHLHGDHVYGLPGVLSSRSFQGAEEALTVIGPVGIKRLIETFLAVSSTHLTYSLKIFELSDEEKIYEDDHFEVMTKKLDHGIPSYGYRIVEKDQPGKLFVDRLKKDGIEPGPIYKDFKNKHCVTLPDGRVVASKNYIGSLKKGRVVAILGDTRQCPASLDLAENADLLIHEATFAKEMEAAAHKFHHSTTVQAAETAKAAGAIALILTHISSRYLEKDSMPLLNEAKAIFPNTYIAYDFWTYRLNHRRINGYSGSP